MFDASGPSGSSPASGPQSLISAYKLEWTKQLGTGVPAMDDEHQRLIEQYNRMVEALLVDNDVDALQERFAAMTADVRAHFAEEERLMIEVGYSGYLDHRAEHEKLLRDSEDFLWSIRRRFEANECAALVKFVKYWLVGHIERADKQFGRFLTGDKAAN